MKTKKSKILMVGLSLLASLNLMACAGSKQNNNDVVRKKAHSAYDAADLEFKESPKSSSSFQATILEGNPSVPLLGQLQQVACPEPSSLRGQGIAEDAQAALLLAQKEIASQIQSSVQTTSKLRRTATEAGGVEKIQSSYQSEFSVVTQLENAQDAKAVAQLQQNGKVGVVACMSRGDAMKPFARRDKALRDSLSLAAQSFAATRHPLEKINLYEIGSQVYSRLQEVDGILESFGLSVSQNDAKQAIDDFALLRDGFSKFRSEYGIHFVPGEGEYEQLAFARLSLAYKFHSGECRNGILLKMEVAGPTCSEGSLGVKCSANLSLSGYSCENEKYFTLFSEVKGNGKYNENEAKDRLMKNIANGDWFDEWKRELDKWVVQ